MARAALLAALIALAPGLPEGCTRALAKRQEPEPAASAAPTPLASATTPPVWAPPDTGGPVPAAPPPNPDLAKARALAQAGDQKKVRALLEKKVKAGKASTEEAALLLDACIALRDKPCAEAVKAKHRELDGS